MLDNKFDHNGKEYRIVELRIDYDADVAYFRALPSAGTLNDVDEIIETLGIKDYFAMLKR